MESEIAQFVNRAENAELQIQELVKELDALAKGVAGGVNTKSSSETSITKQSNQGKGTLSLGGVQFQIFSTRLLLTISN